MPSAMQDFIAPRNHSVKIHDRSPARTITRNGVRPGMWIIGKFFLAHRSKVAVNNAHMCVTDDFSAEVDIKVRDHPLPAVLHVDS